MRLIDADALRETAESHITSVSVCATVEQARELTDFKKRCLRDIDEAPTIGGWISVKDRLPEEEDLYAVYCKDGSMALAWFNDNWFIDGCECGAGYVTHWMPLPEPPKE